MTLDEFKATLLDAEPPDRLPPLLLALWHDARGGWETAHGITQDVDDADGAWVHAYLHRKEGDAANAGYWHRRAGRAHGRIPLDREWEEIVAALLDP